MRLRVYVVHVADEVNPVRDGRDKREIRIQ